MASAEAWIDLLLKRSSELRRAGVLSIGADGCSATLAPADRGDDVGDDAEATTDAAEPSNPWENPASYPTGHVPSIGNVDDADKLPDIPTFGDD